jgi:ABC-2 type transport system permease protein
MTNVWIICRKELKSYFASPIAYLLMAFFALIFGFGFFTATRDFVRFGFMSQMQGRNMPMNVNEQVIRPLLGFASTVALFLIPMITMRLFAEEKKTGTIELLMTSPIYRIGKSSWASGWARCSSICACWHVRPSTSRCCLRSASRIGSPS